MDYAKFGLLPYQIAWLKDASQVKVYEKSRRIGITYTQAFEDVLDAGIRGSSDVWFTSNNEGNGREYIIYCKRFAKALNAIITNEGGPDLLEADDQRVHTLTFKTGKRITALTSNPDQIHGKGGKVILDEFARRENEFETWEAASPAALVWGHPVRIISTHKTKKSLFNGFLERIDKGELDWSRHRTTFPEAVEQGLADTARGHKLTKKERDEYIEAIRRDSGSPLIWRQQYLCQPVDDDETFLPYALLEPAAKAKLLRVKELANCKTLYAGLDVGRVRNLSVLWIAEKVDNIMVTRHVRELRGRSFPNQEKIISQYLHELPIRRLCVDKTGMGIGLTDYLQRQHGHSRIEGVHFTSRIKEEMAFRMRKRLEDLDFLIPKDEAVIDDMHSVMRTTTGTGNIRLSAAENHDTGSHADYFWAAALMLEAAATRPWVHPEVRADNTHRRTTRVRSLFSGYNKLI